MFVGWLVASNKRQNDQAQTFFGTSQDPRESLLGLWMLRIAKILDFSKIEKVHEKKL